MLCYDAYMATRTTVTLADDLHTQLRKVAAEEGISFKAAIDRAIRAGLSPTVQPKPFKTRTFAMGPALLPLDKALTLAGELEDIELIRKRDLGK